MCHRLSCSFFVKNKKFNDSYFQGYVDRSISKGLLVEDGRSNITCHYCKKIVVCKEPCFCKIYYVIPLEENISRLVVHVGNHSHNVQARVSRITIEKVKTLVRSIVQVDRNSGPKRVQMLVARQLLLDALTNDENKDITDIELNHLLEEMLPLVQTQRFLLY